MNRHLPWVSVVVCVLTLGCLATTQGQVTLVVTDGNITCIKAELSASFLITYDTANRTTSVRVPLPQTATVGGNSSCGGASAPQQLVAEFGVGHSIDLTFSSSKGQYRVDDIKLHYNLSDSSVFPGANRTGVVTVETNSTDIVAQVNTTYRCFSVSFVSVGGVNVTFSDVKMEAYMAGDDLSPKETVCKADQSTTTAPPPTTTTAPAPTPPGIPALGDYFVNSSNGTKCLLARMALQLNISHVSSLNQTIQEVVNLQPNQTTSSGSCDPNNAVLVISQGGATNLSFFFTLNSTSNRYHLNGLSLVATLPDMAAPFSASNMSLNYLSSSKGQSFMCSSEQTLTVNQNFSLNTFQLQIQPFGVTAGTFGQAVECRLDQENMLIPIVVGAALAGLVLIVLVAYLIGRKRSHAGYQTI
ncbi:hypothetical protein DPEC_G00148010 [Dallia pectoralis]|uniref:Uncharacterized protein n=1 Tax=Dallia pectoralis TaxID=75939 RepID=A0ACC2GIK8_DALPE|nr:hypothetical protein DPEC_G00148010 [Dallia pectoralis]